MAKSLLDSFLDSIFDEKWVGKRGEKLTERELQLAKLFGRKGKTLRNVYIPKDNGETSEIDVLFITQKGVFVFESKNHSGWIFGSEDQQYWTAMLPNREKNRFYNPIRQNRTHIRWLQKFVGDEVPLFSIIVFSERCELKKIEVQSSDVKVIKRDKTYSVVREIWDTSPDKLSEADLDALYRKLEPLTKVDEAVKAAHIQDIRRKYPSPDPEAAEIRETRQEDSSAPNEGIPAEESRQDRDESVAPTTSEKTCPNCGKPLVIRTAKRGTNAGKQFYGCSGYPACRYTSELPRE